MDFGYAENAGGECILRFDDTNPEAEKQEYIDHINDIVEWMGYKPCKVRWESDFNGWCTQARCIDLLLQCLHDTHGLMCWVCRGPFHDLGVYPQFCVRPLASQVQFLHMCQYGLIVSLSCNDAGHPLCALLPGAV